MTAILNALQDVAATVFGGMPSGAGATRIEFANSLLGKVCSAITGTGGEILLVFTILSLVGLGVGLFRRLTK